MSAASTNNAAALLPKEKGKKSNHKTNINVIGDKKKKKLCFKQLLRHTSKKMRFIMYWNIPFHLKSNVYFAILVDSYSAEFTSERRPAQTIS